MKWSDLYSPRAVHLQHDVKNLWGCFLRECLRGFYAPLEKGKSSMPLEFGRTGNKLSFQEISLRALCVCFFFFSLQITLFKTPLGFIIISQQHRKRITFHVFWITLLTLNHQYPPNNGTTWQVKSIIRQLWLYLLFDESSKCHQAITMHM